MALASSDAHVPSELESYSYLSGFRIYFERLKCIPNNFLELLNIYISEDIKFISRARRLFFMFVFRKRLQNKFVSLKNYICCDCLHNSVSKNMASDYPMATCIFITNTTYWIKLGRKISQNGFRYLGPPRSNCWYSINK